jgi:crotonobetainyl-CoA:carnitine CoA-transferase CaiB-like acyl-CoA transferase
MLLAIGSDSQFASFCRVVGHAALAEDERFRRNAGRVQNRVALVAEVGAILRKRSKREWQQLLDPVGVPCGPINGMDEVFAEPQVRHREMALELPHAAAGTVHSIANPMRLSASPVSYRSGPPLLGQHTQEVLSGLLRMEVGEIESLRQAHVI